VRPRDPADRRPGGITHSGPAGPAVHLDEERAVVVAAQQGRDGWTTEEARRKGLRAIEEGLEYASFAPVVPTVAVRGKDSAALPEGTRRQRRTSACASRRDSLNRMAQFVPLHRADSVPAGPGTAAFYMTQVGVRPRPPSPYLSRTAVGSRTRSPATFRTRSRPLRLRGVAGPRSSTRER